MFKIIEIVWSYRKSWLMFPPNAPLTPTRVPYEESSVYCAEHFYSPAAMEQFQSNPNFNIN